MTISTRRDVRPKSRLRQLQTRNVQRRDCSEGGERYCSRSFGQVPSTRGSIHVEGTVTADEVVSDACVNWCCRAATGALPRLQQGAFGATSLGPLSPIFIVSHGDGVSGIAHSASLEERIAHNDSGTGPPPVKVNDNARVSKRRIVISI